MRIVSILLISSLALFSDIACQPTKTASNDTEQDDQNVAAKPSPWLINLDISGGIAGWHRSIKLDQTGEAIISDHRMKTTKTVTLEASELQKISALVFTVEPTPNTRSLSALNCADCFQYQLEYRTKDARGLVNATDTSNMKPELKQLINKLSSITHTSLRKE